MKAFKIYIYVMAETMALFESKHPQLQQPENEKDKYLIR